MFDFLFSTRSCFPCLKKSRKAVILFPTFFKTTLTNFYLTGQNCIKMPHCAFEVNQQLRLSFKKTCLNNQQYLKNLARALKIESLSSLFKAVIGVNNYKLSQLEEMSFQGITSTVLKNYLSHDLQCFVSSFRIVAPLLLEPKRLVLRAQQVQEQIV